MIVSSCGSENEKGFLGTGVLASTCSTENEGKSSLGSGKGKTTSVEVGKVSIPGHKRGIPNTKSTINHSLSRRLVNSVNSISSLTALEANVKDYRLRLPRKRLKGG